VVGDKILKPWFEFAQVHFSSKFGHRDEAFCKERCKKRVEFSKFYFTLSEIHLENQFSLQPTTLRWNLPHWHIFNNFITFSSVFPTYVYALVLDCTELISEQLSTYFSFDASAEFLISAMMFDFYSR
jgi:hypothetical protein